MAFAKLKFDGREIEIGEGITTLGRASDNDVSFISDSNVSRYHAEIETQGADFWLIELGSSNGTTVNGEKVETEVLLQNGDQILLGGSSEVVFVTEEEESTKKEDEESSAGGTASAVGRDNADAEDDSDADAEAEAPAEDEAGEEEAPPTSKAKWLFGCAGIAVGLAFVSIIAALLFTQCGSPPPDDSGCSAKAKIVSPTIGDDIEETVKIKVALKDSYCIEKAVLYIDGQKIKEVDVDGDSFTADLNPDLFPDLSDGFPHTVWVDLIDDTNEKIAKADSVKELYLQTREIEVAEVTPTPGDEQTDPTKPTPDVGGKVSTIELNKLSKDLIAKLPGNSQFAPDADFLRDVQKFIPEYTSPGYFARAAQYRDVINEAFIKEKGLDASLGYILAMSRTKFVIGGGKGGEGLWAMPMQFVSDNNYNANCAGQTLSDESQNCAAKASSEYMKALVDGVFDGDVVYSVATFGSSTQKANQRKLQLPPDHNNFWKILTRREREQVARFFAAGIVTQNPNKFDLKEDRPISELYNFAVAN